MSLFKKQKYPRHIEGELSLGQQAAIFFWELVKIALISIVIIVPIRYYLIKPFYVKGASMEPTYFDKEYLIIDEITYRFNDPERGEVIVFHEPRPGSQQFFIKRIIGLPGEVVTVRDGKVWITPRDGGEATVLREDYLPPLTFTKGDISVKLSDDEFFVMGDNRSVSSDSRVFGPIHRSKIVGRTLWRGWPLERMSLLVHNVTYNID